MMAMSSRFRLFTFAFAGYFENLIEQEIAKVDFNKHIHRLGVLVARGLVGPTTIAVYKAARLALHADPVSSRDCFAVSLWPSPTTGREATSEGR
jgi:hypothetical protein